MNAYATITTPVDRVTVPICPSQGLLLLQLHTERAQNRHFSVFSPPCGSALMMWKKNTAHRQKRKTEKAKNKGEGKRKESG